MSGFLKMECLHAWYGKHHVLRGVDLHVGEGEIVSLLGRNGAGRSTTLKAAMGQVATSGSIRFKGEELAGLQSFDIAYKGLGYVPEYRDIFPTLTVEQNLILGEKRGKEKRASRWNISDMYGMFPRLEERRHIPAGVLSGGEQQMLALCRTLMGDPDLIMIDEPTEGLAPMMVELVAAYLRQLRQRGIAVLLVEQKLAIALEISERVYVLGHGAVVFEGSPHALRENPAVLKEWIGV
jgi:branched-chain amino acid transport system ATP-binding protein